MIELIKEVLKEHPNADLKTAEAQDIIAMDIMEKLNSSVEGNTETARTVFSPIFLKLAGDITRDLVALGNLKEVEVVYNKIINACRGDSNGTTLLALAETLIALVASAAEQSDGIVQETPEVSSETKTES
jgi:hypothetical protein